MELPHIGKNCDVSTCNMLDFLPFTCSTCGGNFCLQHKSKEDHQCVKAEDSVDKATHYAGETSYACSIEGCTKRELSHIICHHCDANFCLNHRLQEDHSCPKLPEKRPDLSRTAQHVEHILAQKEVKVKVKPRFTNPKSIQTAAKINLMKMKGRAQGQASIPQGERVYFKVILPLESGKPAAEMFFSKLWSVGRVIDAIADRNSIANSNNKSDDQKLRLFHADTGSILPTALSLNEVMEDTTTLVVNGASLILERVLDDVLVLETLDKYSKS